MIRNIVSHDGAIDINSRQTLWSVFLVGVIAPEVFIVQPGFVQGLVQYVGFDDQGAGYTASAEMFGLAATTILMTFIAHRVNWRTVILGSLIVMFLANEHHQDQEHHRDVDQQPDEPSSGDHGDSFATTAAP